MKYIFIMTFLRAMQYSQLACELAELNNTLSRTVLYTFYHIVTTS